MKFEISQSDFLTVTVHPDEGNSGNNSDRFTFELTTPGGQPIEVAGAEVDSVRFTIVGPLELSEFLRAMQAIARHGICEA